MMSQNGTHATPKAPEVKVPTKAEILEKVIIPTLEEKIEEIKLEKQKV